MGNVVGQASNLLRNATRHPIYMDMESAVDRAINSLRNSVGRANNNSGPRKRRFDFDEKDLESYESLWALYERWIRFHKVQRSLEEKHKRFNKFVAAAHFVHNHNIGEGMKRGLSKGFPVFGLNKFADQTRRGE